MREDGVLATHKLSNRWKQWCIAEIHAQKPHDIVRNCK